MTEDGRGDMQLTPVDFDPFADGTIADVLPLTEPQVEMWTAAQMGDEASCTYNQCFSLTLRGALSAESMESALQQTIDRHDALRVSIDANGERQRISASSQIVLSMFDLSNHSAQSRAAEIDCLMEVATRQPFDLAAGPLLRATLVREATDLHRLIITAHHIVCDGWSSAVLFSDLARIYAADRHGLSAQLPLPSSYRDYVAHETKRADDVQARADEDYWLQQYVDSIPVLDLPLDSPRPGIKTYNAARQELQIDESLYQALKKTGTQHGCTLFMTLLAGFEALISCLSGQEDFVIGVPMAGQLLLDNRHLVGHCINMIPLRCRIEQSSRFVDHLKSVRHAFLDAQSHQQLTFGTLVRRLNVPRDPGRTPLVSVTFNMDRIGAPFDFGDLALESVESPPKRFANFEISINVLDTGRDLLLECEYSTDLFTSATIARWLGHYQVLLEAIASGAEQLVGELPLLSDAERHQLLVEWNDTDTDYSADALLHKLVEAQAARTPDAIAVVFTELRQQIAKLSPATRAEFEQKLRNLSPAKTKAIPRRARGDSSVDRLLAHFEVLIEGIADKPNARLSDLPLLTDVERNQLLSVWTETRTDYPKDKTIAALFEEQVSRAPDATAVSFGGKELSYRELNARANRLAHHLISLGAGPDVLVALCLERSIEMVVGLLAILKAGGAYLPLDPTYPKERLAFMLEDSKAPVLISESGFKGTLPEHHANCLLIDKSEVFDPYPTTNPKTATTSDNLAYVIYTSGSTGRPKGVLITHSNVQRLFSATDAWYGFSQNDVWTLFHSYAFDFSVWEIWGALLYGGRLVIVSYETSRSPELFYELLLDERVTILNQTPSAFYALTEADQAYRGERSLSLRLVIFGGEALNFAKLARWYFRHDDRAPQLINMYGITETTVHVTYHPLVAEIAHEMARSVIGRPIPDLSLYILDPHLNPVPIGVAGELHVGGAGLARGYLNRPELTAEKFIRNPFSDHPEERLYKTGDLARYLPDGNIEYLGRIDHQVKIRGFRIELGEIEAILSQHSQVTEAVVIAREDTPGDKRLVAYLVPANGKAAGQDEKNLIATLRDHLKASLPDYMVPAAFVVLDQLPVTPNGKLDRKALPAAPEYQSKESYVAPRNATEEKLAAIWADVLRLDRIGIHDNFFDLGGHSLLVVRLMGEIEKAFGERLSVTTLFQFPTIEGIGRTLSVGNRSDAWQYLLPINPSGSTPPLFSVWIGIATELRDLGRCLGAQQRFYGISSQSDPERVSVPSIEELAAEFLTEVRAVQPRGPYYLSSDCLPCLIAFEMAQQLHAQGERVAALILIDPNPPNRATNSERYIAFRRLKHHLRQLADLSGIREKLAYASSHAVGILHRIAVNVYSTCRRALPGYRLRLPYALLPSYTVEMHTRAAENYVLRRYEGKISFIWARDYRQAAELEKNVWAELATETAHYYVDCEHAESFYEPHVQLLAREVKNCLDDARAGEPPKSRQRSTSAIKQPASVR